MEYRLLADENTSHRLVSSCKRLSKDFPLIHIAAWNEGKWLGLDDSALLRSCEEANLILVGFDRATLGWHAGRMLRDGMDHGGIILYRGDVRSVDYGYQSRLLTGYWKAEGKFRDWQNHVVYLPKSALRSSE